MLFNKNQKTENRSEFIDSLDAIQLEGLAQAHDLTRAVDANVKAKIRLAMLAGHASWPGETPGTIVMRIAQETVRFGILKGASPQKIAEATKVVLAVGASDIANSESGNPLL